MKKLVWVLIFLISISFVSALCEEGQIDINTASLEELDGLYGIGPVKAEAIIDSRPFGSLEELITVYGIGDATLEKIIAQGLACVDVEVEEIEEEPEKIVEEIIEDEQVEENKEEENEDEENSIITLTAKTIKSQDNKKDKGNYAVYGFVGFCVLLGILFIIKNKKYKNEFR